MERIGIAASKMAQGNLVLYNLYVILISFLFSLFLFLIAGSSILIAIMIISYAARGHLPSDLERNWFDVVKVCMITLTVVVSIFNLCAILKNVKLRVNK